VSPFILLLIVCLIVVLNFIVMAGIGMALIRRTKEANRRCAEENRRERETMAHEYRTLAEKTTTALINVGTAIRELSDKLSKGKT